MQKLFTAIMFTAVISLQAVSQKISFGIQAGLSVAHMYENFLDKSRKSGTKVGAVVGVTSNMPIVKHFSFQPAINFVQKGFRYSELSPGHTTKDKMTLNYIEVPFNFLFYRNALEAQIFVGAGPSIAVAVSGNEKEDYYAAVSNYTLHFGDNVDEDDLRRFDFGANFLTGIKFKNGLFAGINYTLGINSLIPGDNKYGTFKNNYLGIRLGYMFRPFM